MHAASSSYLSGVVLNSLYWRTRPSSAQSASPAAQLEYRDNPSGLEKLAKDIFKAQREGDTARAGMLLDSLVLPNYELWYRQNFKSSAVTQVLPKYRAAANRIPLQLARFFVEMQQRHQTQVSVARFEKDCDDDAGEQTFNTLDSRLVPIPLYELRFLEGNRFTRLFAFAYVGGTFRFLVTPDFNAPEPAPPSPAGETKPAEESEPEVSRIKAGAGVTVAKLIKRVQPEYPAIARDERLEGAVRLHAILAVV